MHKRGVVLFFVLLFVFVSLFSLAQAREKKKEKREVLLPLPPAWHFARFQFSKTKKGKNGLSLLFIYDHSEGFSERFSLASLKKPPEIKVGKMRFPFSAQVNCFGTGSPWVDLIVGPQFSMSYDPVRRKFWWEP
ncbi:MAG: hypothetical protein J7L64_05735 [Acidobacteria bacterium]|nr:hypothetical protein [Acidobacteriota bacterium]